MKGFQKYNIKILLGLFCFLTLILLLDLKVRENIFEPKVLGDESSGNDVYPVLAKDINPKISAKGAIVMDASSSVILYSKNPDLRFSSASTTKVMTALTALAYFKPTDILTVKSKVSEGAVLGISKGEKFFFEDLLYALLLPSANDAAFTISQNFPGDFVKVMNLNAFKFNLYNTNYSDPAGLLDEEDYTTPLDLARLSSLALKNPSFAKIVSTKEKVIKNLDGKNYKLKNLNKLLGTGGISGVKTGTTDGAGQILVTAKNYDNRTLIIVVMGSEDRYSDTMKILDSLSGNLNFVPIPAI